MSKNSIQIKLKNESDKEEKNIQIKRNRNKIDSKWK